MELPEEINKILGNKNIENISISINYKNWKGEVAIRKIIPLGIYFGSTEYHKEEQWLLRAWDVDKNDYRTFAVKDILEWGGALFF